jgi:hypothetical protein
MMYLKKTFEQCMYEERRRGLEIIHVTNKI